MSQDIWNLPKYHLKQKVLAFGERYTITNPETGEVLFYIKRDRFGLKTHIHVFAGSDDKAPKVLHLEDLAILDTFGHFRVIDVQKNEVVGELKRNWLKSWLILREWSILDPQGRKIGVVRADSILKSIMRRFFFPWRLSFDIYIGDKLVGKHIRKWSIRDHYVLDLSMDTERLLDRRMAIAIAIILDSAEARYP